MAGSQQGTTRQALPTYGYELDREARRQALMEALQAAGGRLAVGAGTQGWGAVSGALGDFFPAHRQGIERQVHLGEERRRRALEEEDIAYTRQRRAEEGAEKRSRHEAAESAVAEKAERLARQRQAVDELAATHPEKAEQIRKRLGLFVGQANFEEKYAALDEKLSEVPAEKPVKRIRVTKPDGSVVLMPEEEVVAAGGQVRPPRQAKPAGGGSKASSGTVWTPQQVRNEVQQERLAILQEMNGALLPGQPMPPGSVERAEGLARAKVRGIVGERAWAAYMAGRSFGTDREARAYLRGREGAPAPPSVPRPAAPNAAPVPAQATVEDVLAAMPADLRSQADDTDKARIREYLAQGLKVSDILKKLGL